VAALLNAITIIETTDGTRIDMSGVEVLRFATPLALDLIQGDGPTARIEIGILEASADASGLFTAAEKAKLSGIGEGATVASITGDGCIAVAGTAADPSLSIPAAIASGARGTLSGADKAKLDGLAAGAAVASIGNGTSTTVGGTATVPVINVTAASSGVAGSMSGTHFDLVNGATASATALSLSRRGANGEIAYGVVTADSLVVGGGDAGSTFEGAIALTPVVDTYAATVTMRGKDGGKHGVTLTNNVTFATPTFVSDGATLHLLARQGGGGSYTAAFSAAFVFPSPLSGTLLATTVGDIDYFCFEHFALASSHWLCTAHYSYTPPP
jgi:hypothetical protein